MKICTLNNPTIMNNPNRTQTRSQKHPTVANPSFTLARLWLCLLLATGLLAAVSAPAASQTWTNAPADNTWTNILNWVRQAVPGALNSVTVTDVVTFVEPLPISGIGSISNPITNDATRGVRGLVFDTANCGAYVFGNSVFDNPLEVNHTGNIQMGAAVANPIIFKQSIRVRLPNSTNGRYDITNNASNPNATFFFAAITNTSAGTRPLDIYLNGSNTGTNTIERIDDQVGAAGAIRIFKEGTGLWILSSSNDLPQKTSASTPAVVYVEGGTLEVKDPGSLGVITAPNLVIQGSGTLQIDGISLINSGVTLRNGGTLRINGISTNNGIYMGNTGGTSVTLATTAASDVLIVNTNTGGALDTVVNINGPGTVWLDQVSTYLGKWSVNAGTLLLTNAAALGTGANANLNIAAGAIFDVTALGAVTYTVPGSLSASGTGTAVGSSAATIRAASGATVSMATGAKDINLSYNPVTFTGDTTRPALYISQGTLAISGNAFIINNTSGTALGVGTYRLVEQASGSITSGGGYAAVVLGSGLASGTVGTIQVTGGYVNLVVATYTAQNLTWLGGLSGNAWDTATTTNWTNGAVGLLFNPSDNVTFDATGVANSSVNLVGALVPGSVTVDTSAGNYTFGGSGTIAGTAKLTKINSGTLLVQTVNYYRNGTVISNGTLQVGAPDAVPAKGSGDVAVISPGILDLNTNNDTINALTGNGTVDNTGSGAAVLTVGYNDNSGTFSGVLQNTAGTLGLTKIGQGMETLGAANTYTGPTVVNAGTLKVANYNALGSGASPVTVNAGTVDVTTDLNLDSLQGLLGSVITNTTALTNTLIINNTSTNASVFDGMIANGTTGRLKVYVKSGRFQMDGVQNTYSNGTIMAAGTTLAIGAVSGSVATSGRAGTGDVIASNNVTISLPTALSIAATMPNNVITVDGATVNFTSASTGNGFNGQFIGGPTATNIFNGNLSIGGTLAFSNFTGTVIMTNAAGAGTRFFSGTQHGGGDNTTFILADSGGIFTRDASVTRLGALWGSTSTGIGNPSQTTVGSSWWIGAKNLDTVFSGTIQGTNHIVKTGTGVLTLNGSVGTNITTDGFNYYTNLTGSYTNITINGATVISNGVLRLVVPVTLTNGYNGDWPTRITLASPTAVLDAGSMGYFSNELDTSVDPAIVTNIVLYTNGVLEIAPNQFLGGIGTIRGSVLADAGSVLCPGYTAVTRTNGYVLTNGFGTGILTVTNNVNISGAVYMRLNRTNLANCDRLVAGSFTINPAATLSVTNFGPAFQGGEVFQLFNQPVSFTTVNLSVLPSPLSWLNNLAVDGTLVVQGSVVPTDPPYITNKYSGGNLTLSWPSAYTNGYTNNWRLQAQTNTAAVGLSTNWVNVALTTNNVIITVNKTNGPVFYRMFKP
jgi:fibronectin-binding autotransporter adhesin